MYMRGLRAVWVYVLSTRMYSYRPISSFAFRAIWTHFARWAAGALFALTTMTGCSQYIELRAA